MKFDEVDAKLVTDSGFQEQINEGKDDGSSLYLQP